MTSDRGAMKWIALSWIALSALSSAAPDSLNQLRRQVEEQERQIRQLEVENDRLRYMLTEALPGIPDPLYGTKVSGSPAVGEEETPEAGRFHVVEVGDTLSEIAARKGVELDSLVALNQLANPSAIHPGQRLRLPEAGVVEPTREMPAPSPVASRSHRVAAGENLYRISLRYGIDLDTLLAANPAIDPRKLRIGQKVVIPEAGPMLAGGG